MPTNPHLILGNGSPERARRQKEWASAETHPLNTYGEGKNVRLKITDLTDRMAARLPNRVRDLIEIAALVYAADQSCRRVRGISINYGEYWYRTIRFEVAVRDPDFWNQKGVCDWLTDALHFLSDDNYEFQFSLMTDPPQFQDYLDFSAMAPDPAPVERVMLFSGGLDSLAGAVEEILVQRRRVALVSHKPVNHLAKKQRELVAEITRRSGDAALKPEHFPILANRIQVPDGDHTQRTRSFLYASFAAAVADYFGLSDLYFYENGVVSINLPLCAQEIGGRATRTTHPRSLNGYSKLFSLVLGRPFKVNNGFLWDTKEDVLQRLITAGQVDLAKNSLSCSHTRMFTCPSPHCGLCSQCLSRRVAALGAAYGDNDPAGGYRAEVMTASRKDHDDRILAERFVGAAREVELMQAFEEFQRKYAGEMGRVTPYFSIPASVVIEKMFDLHHRHAKQVGKVMLQAMREYAEERRTSRLADTCVANYAFDGGRSGTTSTKPHVDADTELRDAVKRLGSRERECIQALYERSIIGPAAENRPGQNQLAKWAGFAFDTQCKNALAAVVKAGYMDNGKHHGTRGGYFLTAKGVRAGELLSVDLS
jgi:hypothetical protein